MVLSIKPSLKKIKKGTKIFVFILCKTGFVVDMMDIIFNKVFVDPLPYTEAVLAINVPESLAAQFDRPEKEEVIEGYVSRFSQAV